MLNKMLFAKLFRPIEKLNNHRKGGNYSDVLKQHIEGLRFAPISTDR